MATSNAPGCSVESTTFFACHSSGVMDRSWPCLYCVTSALACSRPALDTNKVL